MKEKIMKNRNVFRIGIVLMGLCLTARLFAGGGEEKAVSTGSDDPLEWFNNSNITMVMPYGAGGTSDVVGRKFAEIANKYIKKSIVVVQKTGGDGAVAATLFTAEPPETNDILFTSLGQFYASNINKNMAFDMANVTVVSQLYVTNWILFVRKDSDMTTVDNLIAASKKRILKISGGGVGADAHLSSGGWIADIGGRSEPVSYEGGAAQLAALLSKDVDCFVGNANLGLPYVQRGEIIPVVCFGNTDFTGYAGIKVPCAEGLGYKGHIIGGNGALSIHKGASPARKAALQELSQKVLSDPDWLEWTKGQLLEQRPLYDSELYNYLNIQVENAINSAKALGIYTKS
jgi:tripartite-type tricarboxylate transporter receptor subunit TctC